MNYEALVLTLDSLFALYSRKRIFTFYTKLVLYTKRPWLNGIELSQCFKSQILLVSKQYELYKQTCNLKYNRYFQTKTNL